MDTERGNMEILFQKIPYYYISEKHDYKTVNRQLYLQYAKDVFSFNSEDEIRNKYIYLEQTVKKGNVFSTILDFAKKVLVYDGNEIKCKIDEMLRWREISFQLDRIYLHVLFWLTMMWREEPLQNILHGFPLYEVMI